MRRIIVCLVVVAACCLSAVPVARAASTFVADLAVYRTRNTTTSEAARDLVSFVMAERRFARTVRGTSVEFRTLLRTYKVTFDETDDLVKRIVRDQRTSDRLLADVIDLSKKGHTDAAWVLLKRSLVSQERFLTTITRACTLMEKCNSLHIQLQRAGT